SFTPAVCLPSPGCRLAQRFSEANWLVAPIDICLPASSGSRRSFSPAIISPIAADRYSATCPTPLTIYPLLRHIPAAVTDIFAIYSRSIGSS
ncbi:hypothetical protein, partial [uncultured Chloroflexus sp.]|uniref:hypothetical protein n=1 Tax=uncultured Chloroflexus sp. TaxID=214040 RepID=UPI002619FCEB